MSGAILGAGLAEKFKPSLDIGSCDFDCFRLGNGAAGSQAPQQRNRVFVTGSFLEVQSLKINFLHQHRSDGSKNSPLNNVINV